MFPLLDGKLLLAAGSIGIVIKFTSIAKYIRACRLTARERQPGYRLRSLPLIRHVHFKDMTTDGAWAEMGAGAIDFPGMVKLLGDAGYGGWIMIEDESPRAEVDPDDVTFANGRYIRSL